MARMAVVQYYARLLWKEQIRGEDIPDDIREAVYEAVAQLPPRAPDPITETPERK